MTSGESVEPDVATVVSDKDIAAFAGIQADDTGTATFQRFQWQAKLAVRSWLQLLTNAALVAVVCEHVEDLVVVETAGFRFAQLKTRDKGSWSAPKICASQHAIHRLAQSYLLAEGAGIADLSRFEVWLEGPPSEDKETTKFFEDPTAATTATKAKIREFGLTTLKVGRFLERLSVHCHQPPRQAIDAVVIRTIGALWPALTLAAAERLYDDLLSAAESAQAAEPASQSLMEALSAAYPEPAESPVWEPVALKLLTRGQLAAMCPPLPADSNLDLFERAATGEASMLELKLARAGATTTTIQSALLARADADVFATQGRASGVMTVTAEKALDTRVLTTAGSLVAVAASTAAAVRRPAELIYHSLMSNAANTSALDVDSLYRKDHRLILGHLCSISDQCRFSWGMS
jgi:hypothetical protein